MSKNHVQEDNSKFKILMLHQFLLKMLIKTIIENDVMKSAVEDKMNPVNKFMCLLIKWSNSVLMKLRCRKNFSL